MKPPTPELDRRLKSCLWASFALGGAVTFVLLPALVFFLSVADAMGDGPIDPARARLLLGTVLLVGGGLIVASALALSPRWRRAGVFLGIPAHLVTALVALRLSLYPILVFRGPYWGDAIPFALALFSLVFAGYSLRLFLRREPRR